MIKFNFRKSAFYFSTLEIILRIRFVEVMLLDNFFDFNDSIMYTFLMALGEIFGGLFLYLFIQNSFKKNTKMNYLGIKLIQNKSNYIRQDKLTKIIILIFYAAIFDFIEFIILNSIFYQANSISVSFDVRYTNIQILTSTFLYKFALKNKIEKHQDFSIKCICIISLIEIIIEIIYGYDLKNFFIYLILNILILFFNSFNDIVEKYLGDINFPNPYIITMGEGIFIFIITSIYSIVNKKNPFTQINKVQNENDISQSLLFFSLLIIYIILSAILNVYKIHCNIFFTPIKRAFIHYIFAPFFIIYTFFCENDFINKEGEKSISFFVLSEILLLFFLFFGFVYNEYVILLFCDLDQETKYGIHKRIITDLSRNSTINTVMSEN